LPERDAEPPEAVEVLDIDHVSLLANLIWVGPAGGSPRG
jgi:hypothetical protein